MQPPNSYDDEAMATAPLAMEQTEAQVKELKALLSKYKVVQKEVVRDASMAKTKGKEVSDLQKRIEKWCLDFGASSHGRAGLEALGSRNGERSRNLNDRRNGIDGDNEDERIGCAAIVSLLSQPGFLVPSSKK